MRAEKRRAGRRIRAQRRRMGRCVAAFGQIGEAARLAAVSMTVAAEAFERLNAEATRREMEKR